jgi:hypothetical protein
VRHGFVFAPPGVSQANLWHADGFFVGLTYRGALVCFAPIFLGASWGIVLLFERFG